MKKIINPIKANILFKLFALLVLTFGVPACSCPDDIEPYFEIDAITTSNYIRANNSWDIPIEDGDSIDFFEYRIRCEYDVSYHTYNTTPASFFGINTSYALSCSRPGYEGSKEGMDTLLIITDKDYNDNFKAGDTLSSIGTIVSSNDFIPLAEFIKSNKERIRATSFDIKLSQFPTNHSEAIAFTIVLKLSNGEEYSSTTPKVFFK